MLADEFGLNVGKLYLLTYLGLWSIVASFKIKSSFCSLADDNQEINTYVIKFKYAWIDDSWGFNCLSCSKVVYVAVTFKRAGLAVSKIYWRGLMGKWNPTPQSHLKLAGWTSDLVLKCNSPTLKLGRAQIQQQHAVFLNKFSCLRIEIVTLNADVVHSVFKCSC